MSLFCSHFKSPLFFCDPAPYLRSLREVQSCLMPLKLLSLSNQQPIDHPLISSICFSCCLPALMQPTKDLLNCGYRTHIATMDGLYHHSSIAGVTDFVACVCCNVYVSCSRDYYIRYLSFWVLTCLTHPLSMKDRTFIRPHMDAEQ